MKSIVETFTYSGAFLSETETIFEVCRNFSNTEGITLQSITISQSTGEYICPSGSLFFIYDASLYEDEEHFIDDYPEEYGKFLYVPFGESATTDRVDSIDFVNKVIHIKAVPISKWQELYERDSIIVPSTPDLVTVAPPEYSTQNIEMNIEYNIDIDTPPVVYDNFTLLGDFSNETIQFDRDYSTEYSAFDDVIPTKITLTNWSVFWGDNTLENMLFYIWGDDEENGVYTYFEQETTGLAYRYSIFFNYKNGTVFNPAGDLSTLCSSTKSLHVKNVPYSEWEALNDAGYLLFWDPPREVREHFHSYGADDTPYTVVEIDGVSTTLDGYSPSSDGYSYPANVTYRPNIRDVSVEVELEVYPRAACSCFESELEYYYYYIYGPCGDLLGYFYGTELEVESAVLSYGTGEFPCSGEITYIPIDPIPDPIPPCFWPDPDCEYPPTCVPGTLGCEWPAPPPLDPDIHSMPKTLAQTTCELLVDIPGTSIIVPQIIKDKGIRAFTIIPKKTSNIPHVAKREYESTTTYNESEISHYSGYTTVDGINNDLSAIMYYRCPYTVYENLYNDFSRYSTDPTNMLDSFIFEIGLKYIPIGRYFIIDFVGEDDVIIKRVGPNVS